MRVLRIDLEGLTTSFRYPFFVLGRQPSYAMPPPATIYGHICSAVGELIDPASVRFAYWFTYAGQAEDLEHTHMLSASPGKMTPSGSVTSVPRATSGGIDPVRRQFFYLPRLTLYLTDLTLEQAFRVPRYTVALGRSQDLAAYTSVEIADLVAEPQAYYEHTLLPVTLNTAGLRGVGVTMPRLLDVEHDRAPLYGHYIMLTSRVAPEQAQGLAVDGSHWVDPDTPQIQGAHRGVVFHSFTGETQHA